MVVVAGAVELRDALAAARPGAEILIAPGRYQMPIRSDQTNSGSSGRPVVRACDALGSVVIDGAGASITISSAALRTSKLGDPEVTGGGHHGVLRRRITSPFATIGFMTIIASGRSTATPS